MKGKIIKTNKLVNFCGGCNSHIVLQKFIAIDEGESINEAWERRQENEGDELFKRRRMMAFCLCGNVYIL